MKNKIKILTICVTIVVAAGIIVFAAMDAYKQSAAITEPEYIRQTGYIKVENGQVVDVLPGEDIPMTGEEAEEWMNEHDY